MFDEDDEDACFLMSDLPVCLPPLLAACCCFDGKVVAEAEDRLLFLRDLLVVPADLLDLSDLVLPDEPPPPPLAGLAGAEDWW